MQVGGHSKSTFSRNFQFLTPPSLPWSFLFVLHVPPSPLPPTQRTFALVSYSPLKKSSAALMTLISNKKSGGEKWEKNYFFCTLNIKDQCFLYGYTQWQYKYLHVHKKNVNWKEKKCLRLFNQKTPLYVGLGSKQKTFSNCQATYQKELCLLFENQAIFFHRANVQIGLTPSLLLFVLVHFLRTPPPLHDKRTFWMTPR